MAGQFDYSQFLAALKEAIGERLTGALCVKTADQHAVHILFKRGEIVDLRFGLKRGWASIPLIRAIKRCDFHFDAMDEGDITTLPGLPPANEIMRQLGHEGGGPPPASVEKNHAGGTNLPKALEPGMVIGPLQELLYRHIGPIANMLCEMVVSDVGPITTAEELEQVLSDLAEEIGDAVAARDFKIEAREQLLKLTK